jgi:polyisoprenoid-binding protein YceI
MKYWKHITLATLVFGTLWSCSGSEEAKEEVVQEVAPACFYTFNPSATIMEWTAFKFTNKAPVKGTFNEIEYTGTLKSDDMMAILRSMEFSIPTNTVETQNEDRNGKILKHFFETLNTLELTGKMVSISEDGKATIQVNLNDLSKEVEGTYTINGSDFAFKANMDVAKWDGMPGIDALNKICKDLHTGEDGKSKLWSTIDLSFTTTFTSDCN